MAFSHKTLNRPLLVTALTLNFAFLFVVLTTGALDFSAIFDLSTHWRQTVLPAGVAVIVAGLLTEQFGPNTKARIVFWRWAHPLAGSRAFSEIGPCDTRVDMTALAGRFGPFPTDPGDQNRLWYKIYKTVQDDVAVAAVHKDFLFYRDYSCIAVLLAIVAPFLMASRELPLGIGFTVELCLLAQYLIVRNAASRTGHRFVATVLATASIAAPPSP